MIKAIIFDCFGVVKSESFDLAYRHFGGDTEKDHEFIMKVIYAASSGRIPSSAPMVAPHLGVSEDEWNHAIETIGSVNTELLEFIKKLRKKYKIGMLTNVGKGRLSKYFEPGFLEPYFDDIVASGDIGIAKPEARAYEIAAERLGARLNECIFVDDRQEYIDGAKAVGMQAILYKDFPDFKARLQKVLV